MLIRPSDLLRIRSGEIDVAFRRWDRPRVLAGTKMRTAVGLIEVLSVDRVRTITKADALRAGAPRDELLQLMAAREPKPIWRIGLRYAGEDPRIALRGKGELSSQERTALLERLDRLDRSSRNGPWTRHVLALIEANPDRRAPDLAAEFGRETQSFKRDVRKLKELGLTESLEVGYRLSPRGTSLLHGG